MGFLLIIKKYLLKEALDSVAIIDSPTFLFQKSNSILYILELLSTHPKQFQILDKTKKNFLIWLKLLKNLMIFINE